MEVLVKEDLDSEESIKLLTKREIEEIKLSTGQKQTLLATLKT